VYYYVQSIFYLKNLMDSNPSTLWTPVTEKKMSFENTITRKHGLKLYTRSYTFCSHQKPLPS